MQPIDMLAVLCLPQLLARRLADTALAAIPRESISALLLSALTALLNLQNSHA
jgi:hypothetical protein